MLSRKKKIFIICGFCLLLIITGALNVILNTDLFKTTNAGTVTAGNFFTTYKTQRKDTRKDEFLVLDAIIASSSASAEAKATAEAKKEELLALMEKELLLEGLIGAKGFDDVIISASSAIINVMVKSAELTEAEVAQIYDIIKTQTNYTLDNIIITPVE